MTWIKECTQGLSPHSHPPTASRFERPADSLERIAWLKDIAVN